MGTVPKKSSRDYILELLTDLNHEDEIRVENKKNDRYLIITKSGNKFKIKEVGYYNGIIEIESDLIRQAISEALNREFPRSNFLKVKRRKFQDYNLKILGR